MCVRVCVRVRSCVRAHAMRPRVRVRACVRGVRMLTKRWAATAVAALARARDSWAEHYTGVAERRPNLASQAGALPCVGTLDYSIALLRAVAAINSAAVRALQRY